MAAPAAAPKGIRRLGSLNKPFARPKPKAKVKECCDAQDIQEEDGLRVCANCGTQLGESNIVSDITFNEDSRGAATVQGGFVGENARHANTLGSGAYRRIGGGERNSLQEIENNGRRALAALCPRLNIPDNVAQQAQQLFKLAAISNFNAGRRTQEVVAACLYAACRRQPSNTLLLIDLAELLKVNVFRIGEVYKALKETLYLDGESVGIQRLVEVEPLIEKYCRKLEFGDMTRNVAEDAIKILKRMKRDWMVTGRHPAGLCGACIILAARMNNFRRSVREVVYIAKVADATIVTRMMEFRRTKASSLTVEQFREYGPRLKYQHDPPAIAKSKLEQQKFETKKRKRQEYNAQRESVEGDAIMISDGEEDDSSRASSPTPGLPASEVADNGEPNQKRRRSEEFQAAPAVMQEPSSHTRSASPAIDPASEGPPGETTQQANVHDRTGSEGAEDVGTGLQRQRVPPPAMMQEPRFDADGFAIPALPALIAALGNQQGPTTESEGAYPAAEVVQPKRKRGRPRKDEKPEPVQITEAELIMEHELEDEIDEALNDGEVQDSRDETERAKAEERSKLLADQQRQVEAEQVKARREADGMTWWPTYEATPDEVVSESQLESEFADDPEVRNCMLSESESKLKEQIWLAHNEDWLRSQYEKELLRQVAEKTGADKDKAKKPGKGRKKKGKMGDGSVLLDAETPIETPGDAVQAMLKKREENKKKTDKKASDYLNKAVLERVYGFEHSPATDASESRAASEAPTAAADSQAASRAASEAPSAVLGADRHLATPTAPDSRHVTFAGLPSPRATQQATQQATAEKDGEAEDAQAPASPPPTQDQATEGAADEDGEEDAMRSLTPSVVDDYDNSDREDMGYDDGDDGYDAAINDAAYGVYGDDESYD